MKIEQRFKYEKELLLAKKLIVKCYKQSTKNIHMKIKVKDDKSLVSNVDINLEKSLISAIRKVYKGDNFLTEETSNNTDLSNRTWVIDPIDGTAFFVRNCQFYSVQLAFYDEGETQFSIIYLPKCHDIYVAIRGVGAFLNNKKIPSRQRDLSFERCNVAIWGAPSKWNSETTEKIEKIYNYEKQEYQSPKFLLINSSGFAYTLLASGVVDFFFQTVKTKWDYMPGDLLAKELSAKCYYINGVRFYSFCPQLDTFLNLE